jgi:hypothetical protein
MKKQRHQTARRYEIRLRTHQPLPLPKPALPQIGSRPEKNRGTMMGGFRTAALGLALAMVPVANAASVGGLFARGAVRKYQ